MRHLCDVDEDEFNSVIEALEQGAALITEKIDGVARVEFGKDEHGVWMRSKNGPKSRSQEYHSSISHALGCAHNLIEMAADELPLGEWAGDYIYDLSQNTVKYSEAGIMVHSGDLPDSLRDLKFWQQRIYQLEPLDHRLFNPALGHWMWPTDRYRLMCDIVANLKSSFGDQPVEGVVINIYDRQYKVVDKNSFTRANRFNWRTRELLTDGLKENEIWVPGAVRQLRADVSRAINQPLMRSTSICRKMTEALERGQSPLSFLNEKSNSVARSALDKAIENYSNRVLSLNEEWKRMKQDGGLSILIGRLNDRLYSMPKTAIEATETKLNDSLSLATELLLIKDAQQVMYRIYNREILRAYEEVRWRKQTSSV